MLWFAQEVLHSSKFCIRLKRLGLCVAAYICGMEDMIKSIEDALQHLSSETITDLEAFKRQYIGKQSLIQELFKNFKELDAESKRLLGPKVNALKQRAQEIYDAALDASAFSIEVPWTDASLPGRAMDFGSIHPLTLVKRELLEIFDFIGFTVSKGPEIEDDWHNFTALNFPLNHPARDMQDTFFVASDTEYVLRTHTSGVQVRTMLQSKPPIRVIAPGRVYRCDSDATHSPVFHQLEGLVVDRNVSFKDLKETLFYFTETFFGKGFEVRFRPSYFPFTEPSAEMDIGKRDAQNGIDWMEILGCGMVDPAVLENCGIDSNEFQGYAFGIGIDRLAMLKFGIPDIRLLYENDTRFLRQFSGI